MDQQLVSVIIPVYNSKEFLDETLHSVLNQTWKNVEIIVVDDGSKDNSVSIAKKYENEKFKVIEQQNQGACVARNNGFKASKGDFIQFLDADDILSPNKLEVQVKALINRPEIAAVCNTWLFKHSIHDGVCTDNEYLFNTNSPEDFFIKLWGGGENGVPNMIQTNAWLLPRILIDKGGLWNEKLARDQDGEYFARIVIPSKGIIYTPDAINYYRKHKQGGNISASKSRKHLESMLMAAELKSGYMLSKSTKPEAMKAIATQYKWVAFSAWPVWKDITKSALQKSKDFGGSKYIWVLGDSKIELLKKILGWKTVKSIIHYYSSLKK